MLCSKDVFWSWIWELSKFHAGFGFISYPEQTDVKTTRMYLPTWQKHVFGEFPAVWVASTLHCLTVLVLANTALAWQLSLRIRCVFTGTKWQEGNQTVHICAGGFAICVLCRCFFPPIRLHRSHFHVERWSRRSWWAKAHLLSGFLECILSVLLVLSSFAN